MTILAFDYGRKKIGVALSVSILAEPLVVLRSEDSKALFKKACDLVALERPAKIIVGLSEREIAIEAKRFGEELSLVTRVPVEFADETLSSFDARQMAIEGGMQRKKRREKEDAFAAAIILQRYLDAS